MIGRRYVVDCDGCGERLKGVFVDKGEAESGVTAARWTYRKIRHGRRVLRVLLCTGCGHKTDAEVLR